MAVANTFDELVLIPNCDKIVPAMLMAAARINVHVSSYKWWTMYAGRYGGEDVDLNTCFEKVSAFTSGQISEAELEEVEQQACPGCGSCSGLFTANSMNSLTEVLGMGLPGNGTIAAVTGARIALAKKAGMQVMEMVKKDIKPLDIMTRKAFENAITVDMGMAGSTNTVLHLPAIANEAGIKLELDIFDEISKKTPYLTKLSPSGHHHMQDLHEAGGIPALMKELARKGLLNLDLITVTGKTVEENIANAEIRNDKVIRRLEIHIEKQGALPYFGATLHQMVP